MAALALALGGGALGVGCGDDEKEPPAGEGGSGGTGGEGGGGGACGMEFCATGEECVPGPSGALRCECDPDVDNPCELGLRCDPDTLRCKEPPSPPRENTACNQVGQTINGLQCVVLGDSPAAWRRPCSTGADCKLPGSFCPAEFGDFIGFCFTNSCGSSDPLSDPGQFDTPFPLNGDTWGVCSPSGRRANPPTGRTGTCFPYSDSDDGHTGRCELDGTSTTTCRIRGGDDPANACAPGWICNESVPVALVPASCSVDADCPDAAFACEDQLCVLKSCTDDAECGEGGYCTYEGFCGWEGECLELCNSGTKGAEAGPNAACDSGQICERPTNVRTPPTADHAFGTCGEAECDDETPCNPGYDCVEGRCVECTKDEDCEAGEICGANGMCVDKPGEIGDPCTEDADCSGELVCDEDDKCAEPAPTGGDVGDPCTGDDDCSGDLVCTDDECAEPTTGGGVDDPCTDDEDCSGDLVCTDDKCAEPSTGGDVGDPCTDDDDCSGDLVCTDDECAVADAG